MCHECCLISLTMLCHPLAIAVIHPLMIFELLEKKKRPTLNVPKI